MTEMHFSTIILPDDDKERLNQLYIRHRYLESRFKESFIFLWGVFTVACFGFLVIFLASWVGYPAHWPLFIFFISGLFCASLSYSLHFFIEQKKSWNVFYKTLTSLLTNVAQ